MSWPFLDSLKHYRLSYLPKDLLAGIIVAALTIPISMGYAQVMGLPAVYGLYGSILPIIGYALIGSSPQLIFGVDAAAAAITGSVISTAGIAVFSDQALVMAPVLALFTGLILILFGLFRVGRLVGFISAPVMGGFITGVAVSIMVTQLPKMLGADLPTNEEFLSNLIVVGKSLFHIQPIACAMAFGSLAIILVSRHFLPRFPMPLVIMVVAMLFTRHFGLDAAGVTVLGAVPAGLPPLGVPDITFENVGTTLGYAFTIAVVITSESLLASNTFAMKRHYRLDDNRELIAFGVGNILGAVSGVGPTSASVSRTSASDGFGGKTQVVSLVAAVLIALVVAFCTPWLYYLPTSVLAGIVFAALTTVVEREMAARLWKCQRAEFFIFIAAMLGVLLVGLIFGVVVGVFLSFLTLLLRASNPPRGFLGTLPGHDGYFNIKRFPSAAPLPRVIMYRFSSSLSFANARVLTNEIEDAITPDTRVVILDASGIGSIDITAADRLRSLADACGAKDVKFYIAEQIPAFNDQLERYDLGYLIEHGHVQATIEDCLVINGVDPYPGITPEQFEDSMHLDESGIYVRDGDAVARGAGGPQTFTE